jgi:hypothetical protein
MSHPEFLTGNTDNSRKETTDARKGPPQPIHPTPVPTMYDENLHRDIVGTGAVRLGWGPLAGVRLSSYTSFAPEKFGMTHVLALVLAACL